MAHTMSLARDSVASCTLFDDADLHAGCASPTTPCELLRAMAAACRAEPALNAHYDGEAATRQVFARVDIAVAVDTPEGLIVPVIARCGSKDAARLRGELRALKEAAVARTAAPEDLRDYHDHAVELRHDCRPLCHTARRTTRRGHTRVRSVATRCRRSDGRHRGAPAHALVTHLRSSLCHRRRGGTLSRGSDQGSRAARVNTIPARRDSGSLHQLGSPRRRAARPDRASPIDVTRFIRAYYRGVGEEDLATHRAEDLAGAALAPPRSRRQATHGTTRWCGCSIPTQRATASHVPHTLIVMTTDDMPFLVDSIGIAINQSGLAIHFIAHPILHRAARPQRDAARGWATRASQHEHTLAESWQLFEVDRITDPQRARLACANASSRCSMTCAARRATGWRCAERARDACERTGNARARIAEQRSDRNQGAAGVDGGQPLHVPRLSRISACDAGGTRTCSRPVHRVRTRCAPSETSPTQAQAHRAERRDPRTRALQRRCSSSPRRTRSRRCIARPISTTSASRLSTRAAK